MQRLDPADVAARERRREQARKNRERQERLERHEREKKEQREYQQLRKLRSVRYTFVIRRNLVCVRDLAPSLCTERVLRREDMFGGVGAIRRVLFVDSIGVYIEYESDEAASRAVSQLNGERWHGREVRVSFATVRYCEVFVRACESYVKAYEEWQQKQKVTAPSGSQVMAENGSNGRHVTPSDASLGSSSLSLSANTANHSKTYIAPDAVMKRAPVLQHHVMCANSECIYQHDLAPDVDAISRESFLESNYGPPPPLHTFSYRPVCVSSEPKEHEEIMDSLNDPKLKSKASDVVYPLHSMSTDLVRAPLENEHIKKPHGLMMNGTCHDQRSSIPEPGCLLQSYQDPEYRPVMGRKRIPLPQLHGKAPGSPVCPTLSVAPVADTCAPNVASASGLSSSTGLHWNAPSTDQKICLASFESDPAIEAIGSRRSRRATPNFGIIGQRATP